jgi:hypothetical protein
MLQGYTDNDYSLTVIDQSLGSVGHNCNIVIFGNPYVWTEKGPYMFNGQWHPLSPENMWVPVSPAVDGSPGYNEGLIQPGKSMFATLDPYFNTYICSQAFIAAREQEQPWKYKSQPFSALFDDEQLEGSFGQSAFPWDSMVRANRYYAVLDYTMVQPESGGRFSTGGLSWDTKVQATLDGLDFPEWMHYLRNRWGQGALYLVGTPGIGGSFGIVALRITDYSAINWNQEAYDFMNFNKVEQLSHISLAYDMIGDPGGYEMEQKSFKRLWFHMRRNINGITQTQILVKALPNSGFFGDRMVDAWLLEGTPGVDGVRYKGAGEYYPILGPGIFRTFPRGKAEGDVIMPPKPQFLTGRGLWVQVTGKYFQWHGFGGEYIVGREQQLTEEDNPGP